MVLFVLLLLVSVNVIAQDTKVYNTIEKMPSFPGGSGELFNFLSKNIRYPVEAEKNGIQGRVLVQFVVMPDGAIDSVKVVKHVDPNLDKEAVRLVRAMPKWIPGMQNGKPVKTSYTVPITFGLR